MKAFLAMMGAVCGLTAAGAALAQTATAPTHVLTTVDSVRRYGSATLFVTGVVEGASGPTEVRVYDASTNVAGLDACERFALTAMAKPGQYRLEIWVGSSYYATGYCRLSKVNP